MTNIEKLEYWVGTELRNGLKGIRVNLPPLVNPGKYTANELAEEILTILETTPVENKEFV